MPSSSIIASNITKRESSKKKNKNVNLIKHLDSTTKSQEGVGKGIYGMTLQNQDCETGTNDFFFQQINFKGKKG